MNNFEQALYKALTDLKSFLLQLVLVGGWVPHVYQKWVWKDIIVAPHFTTDVDFGVPSNCKATGQNIYQTLSGLHYPERHLRMDRLTPVVPQIKTGKDAPAIPLEFLCDQMQNIEAIKKFIGPEIQINALPHFDLLLSDLVTVPIQIRNNTLQLRIPSESIFILHKLITFQLRDTTSKAAKDLYYVYYMLRFSPHMQEIVQAMRGYHSKPEWKMVKAGLQKYFADEDSEGPILVEREFGTDSLINNLRRHILETFKQLL